MKNKKIKKDKSQINYLNLVINQNKKMIALYLILGIVVVFLETYAIKYFEYIIDAFENKSILWINILIYAVVLFFACILSYLDTYPINHLKNKLYFDFKKLANLKMDTIDFPSYQHLGLGKSTQLIESGAMSGKDILQEFHFRLIRELIPTIFFSLLFIATIDIKIMFVILASYIIVFLFTKLLLNKLYQMKEKLIVNVEDYNKNFVRNIMEMLVFRINRRYKSEIEKIDKISNNIVKTKANLRMIHESFFTVFEILVIAIKIFILCYALFFSSLQIGALVALISLIGNAYKPIAIFNVVYIDYKLDKITFKRYEDFLNIKDDENMLKGAEFNFKNSNIKFDNVGFGYENKRVLENISFDIQPNTSVAFVGNSGSGKSTIIKLMLGLIKNDKGEIFISEQNLKNIDLKSFYKYVSYISQDSPIFDGTLRENLVFDKNIDDEKIIEVIKKVDLFDFYKKLPNGLDTEIGEKGVLMSGGERQRVAIGRTFFEEKPFMLFDEATSALDNITEKDIIDEIMKLNNRTKIFVAHRLSTIENVDNIYVVNQNGICESGNFNELMGNKSYFYELYKASETK
ncbi:MAG: ABC transporter ATP-binding protein [Clostridia bacterium]|nr:ABC transporter ATP-binding protein [Clostridia bacterium]